MYGLRKSEVFSISETLRICERKSEAREWG